MTIADTLAEITKFSGIDFDHELKASTRSSGTSRLIHEKRVDAGDLIAARNALLWDTTDRNFEKAWQHLEALTLRKLVYDALQSEQTDNSLMRKDAQLSERLAQNALAATQPYVTERAAALAEISTLDLEDADQAIADGHADEYRLTQEISQEFTTLAELADPQEDAVLVIVEPPEVPQYVDPRYEEPEVELQPGQVRYEDEVPADRSGYEEAYEQIQQFAKADSRQKYLLAARFGWPFTLAASPEEIAERQARIDRGSTYIVGVYRVPVGEDITRWP